MSTKKSEPDGYDDAIAYLTEYPDEISQAWFEFDEHPAGILFSPVAKYGDGPCGFARIPMTDDTAGCLTEVRNGTADAWDDALTREIRKDKQIPRERRHVSVETLHVFAEWQRRIDVKLDRTPPARMAVTR